MGENNSYSGKIKPNLLRCEYLINPLGIDVLNPRLSWVLNSEEQNQKQAAYRILVASNEEILSENNGDLWDSDKILSDQSIHITYNGKALESQMFCYWKVQVWDIDDNSSDWSQPAMWSMGLINPKDWKAKWIGTPAKRNLLIKKILPELRHEPSPLIRKSFSVDGKIKRAIVYVTALGHYELYINGNLIGDHIFAPEWTDYNKRVQYQTYDVTDFLQDGENVIAAILADGWYKGYLGPIGRIHNIYGVNRRFLMQMSIEQIDGNIKEIITDSHWKIFKDGPIRHSDHFFGELYDAQKEQSGWDQPSFDDSKWSFVTVDKHIKTEFVAQMNEPIRIVKEIKPIAYSEPKPGIFIFNIGQNIAGWCKIKLDKSICDANATVTLRHGEMLKRNGTLYTANLRTAKAIDKFILNGIEEREYHPHFTYHGFQYVEVKGLKPGIKPNLDIITACVIASDSPLVSAFESSDSTLNKLWNNILWTQRDNMISVPTDCPQRDERMGWTGDAQVFSQTSIFNMDMAAFYTKWLRDIRDAQTKNGSYPDFIPYSWKILSKIPLAIGTPAWADCGLILPWNFYLNYADKEIIKQHYESAKHFIDFIYSRNSKLVWKKASGRNYGDWLNGNKIKSKEYPRKGAAIPKDVFATAYLANSTQILAKMAEIINLNEDFKHYSDLARRIKEKFSKEFVREDGKIKGDTQAGYAIALHFNLLPEEIQQQAVMHMLNAIKKYNDRISTGFCTTLMMMMQLVNWGYQDLAYKLLLSRKFPSWFYMIDQGATTIWERWDGFVKGRGFQSKRMNSFCHYSIGSIGEFIYRVILGINFDEDQPAYKHITIKPIIDGSLTWAKGYYNSIYGKIEINWSLENSIFDIEVTIPANTTATIYLPTEDPDNITESGNPIHESDEVKFLNYEKNVACYKISSGKYKFRSKIQIKL